MSSKHRAVTDDRTIIFIIIFTIRFIIFIVRSGFAQRVLARVSVHPCPCSCHTNSTHSPRMSTSNDVGQPCLPAATDGPIIFFAKTITRLKNHRSAASNTQQTETDSPSQASHTMQKRLEHTITPICLTFAGCNDSFQLQQRALRCSANVVISLSCCNNAVVYSDSLEPTRLRAGVARGAQWLSQVNEGVPIAVRVNRHNLQEGISSCTLCRKVLGQRD